MTKWDDKKVEKYLYALAAGDCIGVTTEFMRPQEVKSVYRLYGKLGWPFISVGRTSFGLGVGAHSDDTDMAWAIVKAFYDKGKFDANEIAKNFGDWYKSGPRDIGKHTREVLKNYVRSGDWYKASRDAFAANPNGAANGSLMRNGVIVAFAKDLNEALSMSFIQSIITHFNPIATVCCLLHTWLIWEMESGVWPFKAKDWMAAFSSDLAKWDKNMVPEYKNLLDKWEKDVEMTSGKLKYITNELFEQKKYDHYKFNPFDGDYSKTMGYSVLSLQIAIWALRWSADEEANFGMAPDWIPLEVFAQKGNDALGWIGLLGWDSDTYGAITGPLLAAKHGPMPDYMTNNLQIRGWFEKLKG